MIARLSGKVLSRTDDAVVVDVGGVGYEVTVPRSTAERLPGAGSDVVLHVHTHLREDSLSLYGFSTALEKEIFLLLRGVAGIGPKLALSALSNLEAADLIASLRSADESRLCSIPGIGRKTAARLCLELKDRVMRLDAGTAAAGVAAAASGRMDEDAVSALVNLGYKRLLAEEVVRKAQQGSPGAGAEELIRAALVALAGR